MYIHLGREFVIIILILIYIFIETYLNKIMILFSFFENDYDIFSS